MDDHTKAMKVVEHATPETQRMHPLVQAVVNSGRLDTESMRGVLQMQREWEAHQAHKAFVRAFSRMKTKLPAVVKRDKMVDFGGKKGRVRYQHASLANIIGATTPALTEYGFTLAWHTDQPSPGQVSVTCELVHCDGHKESTTLSAPPDDSGGKSPPQQIASTVSLLKRYTAQSLLGVADEDDKEPTGEADKKGVDSRRNLRVAKRVRDLGKEVTAAEELTGRSVAEWTVEDIDKIAAWAKGPTEEQKAEWDNVGPPAMEEGKEEPGADG